MCGDHALRAERRRAERAAQGLPAVLEDPVAAAQIAAVVFGGLDLVDGNGAPPGAPPDAVSTAVTRNEVRRA